MDIRNPSEFRNFVNLNGLTGLRSSFGAVVTCITDYEHGCDCWRAEDRNRLYNNCKVMYAQAVMEAMGMGDTLLRYTPDKKINFYQDGGLIGSMRR